jgi:hypothetical protein
VALVFTAVLAFTVSFGKLLDCRFQCWIIFNVGNEGRRLSMGINR